MRGIRVLLAFAALWPFAAGTKAQTSASVTITWNPSISTNVVGYDVYYGTSSGLYTNIVAVSNVTNATINGLISGTRYYFAGTAINSSGLQSPLSPGISVVAVATVPAPALLTLVSASPAGRFSFMITNQSGAQYALQASTNLINWVTLQTNISPFKFVDTNAGLFNRRFYRAVSVPN
jgi:hypothetical protein